jgi:hypothetical protein
VRQHLDGNDICRAVTKQVYVVRAHAALGPLQDGGVNIVRYGALAGGRPNHNAPVVGELQARTTARGRHRRRCTDIYRARERHGVIEHIGPQLLATGSSDSDGGNRARWRWQYLRWCIEAQRQHVLAGNRGLQAVEGDTHRCVFLELDGNVIDRESQRRMAAAYFYRDVIDGCLGSH